jgi:hypothetical protein
MLPFWNSWDVTKTLPFTELAIRRAVSAARKAGISVGGVEVRPDGTIVVLSKDTAPAIVPKDDAKWKDLEV